MLLGVKMNIFLFCCTLYWALEHRQEGPQNPIFYLIHSSLISDHNTQIIDVVLAHAKFKWI